MANYCNHEDVSIICGFDSFSAATRPTLAQVNAIIADITNEIDFVLSGVGITIQPTDTKILARLKMICKYGVACQVVMSAYGNATSTDNSQADKFCEKYKEYLSEIKSDPELYGSVSGDSSMYISNAVIDGTYSETDIENTYINKDYEY